ncbi:MAG: DUF3450 family protein [Verrucomicrobiota bacterium]|nr:DUF3450 family protein [Verrucomicrobiota bacterium]
MFIRIPLQVLLLSLATITTVTPSMGTTIRDTQEELTTWVETKKVTSEAKATWESEKVIVADLISLLEQEKEKLITRIAKLEANTDSTDTLRTKLNADKEALLTSTKALELVVPDLENRIRSIIIKLPAPLLEEIQPLLLRLPEPEDDTRMSISQRLLTVVGILNKIDKFNTGITLTSEIRSIGDKSLEVKTLYYGLAGAYFASESAGYAGMGTPSEAGWEWFERPEYKKQILNLIETYEGAREAIFVELPVVAK